MNYYAWSSHDFPNFQIPNFDIPIILFSSQTTLIRQGKLSGLLHFVAFFHVASLFSTGVDNKKGGVDNEKALELDNRIIFSYFSLILVKKYHLKMQQNILLHSGMITTNIVV